MKSGFSCLLAALAATALAGCSWLQSFGFGGSSTKRAGAAAAGRLRESTLEEIEAEASRPRAGLKLLVSLDKASYLPTEPIVLDVRIQNVTGGSAKDEARDIHVYFEPFAKMADGPLGEWLIKFVVRSEKDEELRYRSPEFDVKEADRGKYYHFVTLPPQAFIGRKYVFPPATSELWRGRLTSGRYNVMVTYAVSEDYPYVIINRFLTESQVEALGRKLAYVHIWTGEIFSNRVDFTIRSKRGWLW